MGLTSGRRKIVEHRGTEFAKRKKPDWGFLAGQEVKMWGATGVRTRTISARVRGAWR
jgi:hypothetical protein